MTVFNKAKPRGLSLQHLQQIVEYVWGERNNADLGHDSHLHWIFFTSLWWHWAEKVQLQPCFHFHWMKEMSLDYSALIKVPVNRKSWLHRDWADFHIASGYREYKSTAFLHFHNLQYCPRHRNRVIENKVPVPVRCSVPARLMSRGRLVARAMPCLLLWLLLLWCHTHSSYERGSNFWSSKGKGIASWSLKSAAACMWLKC